MKFKTGDKVKFLNKKGGGYVTEVLADNIVKVLTETGFEFRYMTNELILIDPQSSLEKYFDEDFNIPKDKVKELTNKGNLINNRNLDNSRDKNKVGVPNNIDTTTYYGELKLKLNDNKKSEKLNKGLILAYIPHNQESVKKDDLTISIINYTEHKVYYNLYFKKSTRFFENEGVGEISPYSRLNLCSIERKDLLGALNGNFQAFFVVDKAKIIPSPINSDINLKLSFFDVNENYKYSNVIDERAILVSLDDVYRNDDLVVPEEETKKDLKIALQKKLDTTPKKPKQLIDNHKIGKHKAEVDLHISALRTDFSKLKAGEIISIQRKYFIDTLESAIVNNYSQVIFIHGIGNGTLKDIITDILKHDYPDLDYHDAPFNKYGYGAIVVIIKE